MALLGRLRARLKIDDGGAHNAAVLLAEAERLLRRGGDPTRIEELGQAALSALDAPRRRGGPHPEDDLRAAAAYLCIGDLEAALPHAYAAANDRPYDVDSRIVHGNVRLARNELEAAAHEFDAVIEEFGADSDAADGRRAVILARGHAPADEIPATDDDWQTAATLLAALWRQAGLTAVRLAALEDHADPRTLSLLRQAAE